MKLNRSAVILAVAIVLLIIALFAVRSGEETEVILLNATNLNATNATAIKTTNGTLPASNATIEKQVNATQDTGQGAGQANATVEKTSKATAPAASQPEEKSAPAAKTIEKAKIEASKKGAAKPEVKKQETKKTEALKTNIKEIEAKRSETKKANLAKSQIEKEPSKEPKTPAVKESAKSAPVKAGASKPAATEHIKQQLNDYGAKRIVMLNAGLRPNKSNKEVNKRGNEYVARYYYVSSSSLRTEATPADSSAPFLYVGKVRYQECLYECRANTREEAMNGEGVVVQQRNMLELIRYTNKWTE